MVGLAGACSKNGHSPSEITAHRSALTNYTGRFKGRLLIPGPPDFGLDGLDRLDGLDELDGLGSDLALKGFQHK